jgi:uncharacterized protein
MRINLNDVRIEHNSPECCFEAILNGQRIGLADYRLTGTKMAFTHTEVDPAYQGQGVADKLIHTALEYAQTQQSTVTPICWFVVRYIERHPEYQVLTA